MRFSRPLVFNVMDKFFINSQSERQVKRQRYSSIFIILFGSMEFSTIFESMCRSWQVFPRSRDTKLCVPRRTGLFVSYQKRHDGPPLKSSIFTSVAIALAFSLICTVTSQPTSLWVFTRPSWKFSWLGYLLWLPVKAFVVFLHWLSSSRWRLHWLPID